MKHGDRKLKQSESMIEALRIERTNLNQKEFAEACKIPLKTYQRWILGKTETRPNLIQLKLLCKQLKIEKVDELPDDFSDKY
ncbi:MAG: helix-turn-helix domain-containing protein [Pleurocapsa minor HA4230-MV1]|jgi:transcriptional regulator with XRE-family HTH domain|nr:helix-turn-helix domain-containing protein [Pleurocapsa minor HA4230-MV1]